MKVLVLFIAFFTMSLFSYAEEPFTKSAFENSQKKNEKIILDFFADWCPTCQVQAKSLKKLEEAGFLDDIKVFRVDYDNEIALKKSLNVNAQSTLVTFYGTVETGRSTGITKQDAIKEFLNQSLKSLNLKDQLKLMKEASRSQIPTEKLKIMSEALDALKKSKIEKKVIKVGALFPDFQLKDASGKIVRFSDLRKNGFVVVTFYRGSWCPYCNAQLSDFQKNLDEITKKGAQLVAITPEKPDLNSLMAVNKTLEFQILNDKDNKLASKLGLVFGVPKELKEIYQKFGIDLEKSQGNSDWKLPIPATFIVGKDGKVKYSFVSADYTERASSQDILNELSRLGSK